MVCERKEALIDVCYSRINVHVMLMIKKTEVCQNTWCALMPNAPIRKKSGKWASGEGVSMGLETAMFS